MSNTPPDAIVGYSDLLSPEEIRAVESWPGRHRWAIGITIVLVMAAAAWLMDARRQGDAIKLLILAVGIPLLALPLLLTRAAVRIPEWYRKVSFLAYFLVWGGLSVAWAGFLLSLPFAPYDGALFKLSQPFTIPILVGGASWMMGSFIVMARDGARAWRAGDKGQVAQNLFGIAFLGLIIAIAVASRK